MRYANCCGGWKRSSAVLIVLALFSTAHAAQFELPRESFLIDETIPIVISGLPPGEEVTIALHSSDWSSSATFNADSAGLVDVTRVSPKRGTYNGVDAMGLFWSAERSTPRPAPGSPLPTTDNPPQPWQLTAEVHGSIAATATVLRRVVAENVAVTIVRERGLVGVFYRPAGEGRHPAMLVLRGSGGGVPPASSAAGGLASHGYAVLALAYFGIEDLPPSLSHIPLEYFKTALEWMSAQPSVDPARIGVLGASRGAELALLLGAIDSQLRAVVAYMPSNVVWAGCCDRIDEPSWTPGGLPVAWANPRRPGDFIANRRAEIPVEHIHGGVLLISGKQDGVWHSTEMADAVMNRLRRNHFAYPYTHLAYDNAGHAIGRPGAPTTDVDNVRHPLTGRVMHLGGTPAGTAHAREDSWRQMLAFVDKQL
ncbi:MAG: hypothetical protein DMF58_15455 [Acidobacteria bacterium]|nr:MAG: hypothetical protein DMF58_15455 [Acidobacteriota bacterium]